MPSVAVVGASAKPERYSYMAVERYAAAGWTVYPVHPAGHCVAGIAGFTELAALPERPTVISMYLNPKLGVEMLDALVAAAPDYLWLNPGADGEPIARAARARGLRVVETCNLVALSRGDPLAIAAELAGPVAD
ncbi:MAG: CoA-binding protein [Planctomycetota bacterium]|jgi:predicted CoA-binding protein|nr:CoA-binding protein [Planctomycetota bacterium]